MNALQTQHVDAMTDLVAFYKHDAAELTIDVTASIAEARAELDKIEENLRLANAGEPFLNIGEVRGVDAGVVFRAFGAIDNATRCERKLAEYKEQSCS
jgi:hypothetical protein